MRPTDDTIVVKPNAWAYLMDLTQHRTVAGRCMENH